MNAAITKSVETQAQSRDRNLGNDIGKLEKDARKTRGNQGKKKSYLLNPSATPLLNSQHLFCFLVRMQETYIFLGENDKPYNWKDLMYCWHA